MNTRTNKTASKSRNAKGSKPAPKPAAADKAPKAKRERKSPPRPTETPVFLDQDNKILIDPKSEKPIKLKGRDFPTGKAGHQAFCDYNIALWVWKRESRNKAGTDRRQKRLEKLREQIALLEKELGN